MMNIKKVGASVRNNKNTITLILLLGLCSCEQKDDLIYKNLNVWNKSNIDSYEFEYIKRCYCINDNILQKSIVKMGVPVKIDMLTIDKVFEFLTNLPRGSVVKEIQFDEKLGYPILLDVRNTSGHDLDLSVKIVSFNSLG